MNNTPAVRLDFFQDKYLADLTYYHLSTDQLMYTAHPKEALAKEAFEARRHGIVILFQHHVAGFFVLEDGESLKMYSDNQQALLLCSYSIAYKMQGRGIAKQSLLQLPAFLNCHFPKKNEVVLGVNHQNMIAQHVYQQCGFVDSGKRIIGKKGEQYVLQLNVMEAIH